tara:strand:+ start:392 stop:511 length:120 start_codon:yes stop_codon:yes gene_type:complete
MNEQDKLNGEYMTGWEIIGATITFAVVVLASYLLLIIGG